MSEANKGGGDGVELPLDFRSEPAFGEDVPPTRWSRTRRAPALFEFDETAPTPVRNRISDNGDGDGEAERPRQDRPAAQPTVGNGFTLAERQDPEGMFQKARATALEGRLPEAIALYREIVATYPAHVRARNNLGVLLDQSGSHEAALEHFYAAVGLEPENPELLTNFGAALASTGQYVEAEAQLRKAARLDPGGLDVRANLGILHFRRGLYVECEEELRWVCEHDKEHALAYFYRGEALNRLGKVDEALETLERAVVLQPGKARIYYLLGILYDRKNLPREAAPMYRRARELSDP
jgi:Flp pilus assembly protein TadD